MDVRMITSGPHTRILPPGMWDGCMLLNVGITFHGEHEVLYVAQR
jgi:hypothetical protein